MPDNEGARTMESRMESVENHINGFIKEDLPSRVKALESGHKQLEESDRNQRLLIEAIAEQMKTHTEKQSETNFKVDNLSQSVQMLSGMVAESSAVNKVFLTKIDENTKFLQSQISKEKESAVAIEVEKLNAQRQTEVEKQTTKRHTSTEVLKFLTAIIGGGAGVALINYLQNQ